MPFLSLLPALIATLTTFALFLIKDWFFSAQQRKKYAKRLLIHCCRSLSEVLEMNPNSFDIKLNALELYIDVYLKNPKLNNAFSDYLHVYFYWRGGMYLHKTGQIIVDAKNNLQRALDNISVG